MSPSLQCALWKDRIATAIADSATEDQKRILQQIHDLLTPSLYRDTGSAERMAEGSPYRRILILIDSTTSTFGADSTRFFSILTTLGPATEAPIADETEIKDCNCSTDRNGMLRANDCGALSRACQIVPCIPGRGCGVLWLNLCDGCCNGVC
jgi:hypothetical protein